jgi:RNA 2',3'-cyclic 3'-phosphodiesterase
MERFAFSGSVCYFFRVSRLFVAALFSQGLWERFAEVRALPGARSADLAWSPAANLHLTLKFLGEVPDGRLAAACGAVRRAAEGRESFGIRWRGLGAFPGERRPEVVWVGVGDGGEALARLAAAVEDAFAAAGFERGSRDFRAHLTLARARRGRGLEGPLWPDEWARRDFGADAVGRVALMKSFLQPGGAVHEPLEVVALEDRENQQRS